MTRSEFRHDINTPHRHAYRFAGRIWNGHAPALSWFCKTCPVGFRSARIIPVEEFWA